MKLIYNKEASFTTNGVTYTKSDKPYEVADDIGKYLLDTFTFFTLVEAPKPAPKPKAKPVTKKEPAKAE